MSLAVKITPTAPLGSRRPVHLALDLAALVGIALTIGLAVGLGLMFTVVLLA